MRSIAEEVAAGRLSPNGITERTIARHLYVPELPEVDLFLRSSGEQRTSNFMLWQSAYAEMVFLDALWPDFDRRELWRAIEIYQDRDHQISAEQSTSRTQRSSSRRRVSPRAPRRLPCFCSASRQARW